MVYRLRHDAFCLESHFLQDEQDRETSVCRTWLDEVEKHIGVWFIFMAHEYGMAYAFYLMKLRMYTWVYPRWRYRNNNYSATFYFFLIIDLCFLTWKLCSDVDVMASVSVRLPIHSSIVLISQSSYSCFTETSS